MAFAFRTIVLHAHVHQPVRCQLIGSCKHDRWLPPSRTFKTKSPANEKDLCLNHLPGSYVIRCVVLRATYLLTYFYAYWRFTFIAFFNQIRSPFYLILLIKPLDLNAITAQPVSNPAATNRAANPYDILLLSYHPLLVLLKNHTSCFCRNASLFFCD